MLIGTVSTARTQHHAPSQLGVFCFHNVVFEGVFPRFLYCCRFSCLYWFTGYMLNHVDAVCFFCYMVGSTFLGHAVQFITCEPRVLFHCFVRSSVHDDAVGDHSIREFRCIMFVRFFHPEVHLHFARSGICVISY